METIYYLNLFLKNNVVQGMLIILFTILLASLVDYLIWFYIKRITTKTNTYVDDFLVNVFMSTIHWFIIVIGFNQAMVKLFNLQITQQVSVYYKIIIILLIAYIVSKLLAFFIGHWLKVQKGAQKIPRYVSNIVTTIIFLIAITIIFSILNISITPLLTSFGIAGLVIALSLQNTLTNFIAGIKIIAEEKVKIGDFVDDGENIRGVVEDMSLNSVRIRNLNNNIIIVPNTKISDSPLANFVRDDNKIRLVIPVTVVANDSIDKIKTKLTEITKNVFENEAGIDKRKMFEVWLINASQANSMILPVLTFNILITISSYKYQFSITDCILSRVAREFLSPDGKKTSKTKDLEDGEA